MNDGLIPRRYAKALYKVTLERSDSERMYGLMQNLDNAFGREPRLQQTVANPFVSDAEKQAVLNTAAGATATDATFADFLKLLARNGRLDRIHEIAAAYADIYRAANNIKRVEVVSAAPLGKDTADRIKQLVKQHAGGATIDFNEKVDPALIGGFVVNIDNERLDASLRNEFKQLRQSLLN